MVVEFYHLMILSKVGVSLILALFRTRLMRSALPFPYLVSPYVLPKLTLVVYRVPYLVL